MANTGADMNEFTQRAVKLSEDVMEGRITVKEWGVQMDALSREYELAVEVF